MSLWLPRMGVLATSKGVVLPPLYNQVDLLRTNPASRGSRLSSGYKIPGVDTLPNGLTYSSATKRVNLNVGLGTGLDIEGWDFRGCWLTIQGNVGVFRDCLFGMWTDTTIPSLVDIYAAATVVGFEYCTFYGNGFVTNHANLINTRITAPSTVPALDYIRYCTFYDYASDCIIIQTKCDIYRNYFDTPTNLLAKAPEWSASVTYALDEYVYRTVGSSMFLFKSLQANNIGNQPPGSLTSNAFWQNRDPHCDTITVASAAGPRVNPTRIYENYFNMSNVRRERPGYAHGINNTIRVIRNSGTTTDFGLVIVENNILMRDPTTSVPVQLNSAPNMAVAGTVPSILRDNWIAPSVTGALWYPGDETRHTISGNLPIAYP